MSFQHYRVTAAGVIFGLVLVLAGGAAFVTANNLLFLIFSTTLALLLVSGFLNRLVLAGLELELLLPPHVSARCPAPALIRLRNLKYFTPSFSIEVSAHGGGAAMLRPVLFSLVRGRGMEEAPVEMTFERRGRHRESVFLLSSGFPFGFIRRSTHVALKHETIVYPAIGLSDAVHELTASDGFRWAPDAAGLDFYRIRPYMGTDSARLVDWKTTAHTGELQVREFTREQGNPVEIYLDRRAPPESSRQFEEILERCASLVWSLAESGADIRFFSQGCTLQECFAILRYLALTQATTEALERSHSSGREVLFHMGQSAVWQSR